jgi:putative addiction module component (TIGR02574 family)
LNAELDRRLAAHEANPSNVRTWEQIQARLGKPK